MNKQQEIADLIKRATQARSLPAQMKAPERPKPAQASAEQIAEWSKAVST